MANERERVDVTLELGGFARGTQFRVLSDAALPAAIQSILIEVNRLLADEQLLLRCPECRTRYVHLKEGRRGPFLSCDGMRVSGTRASGKFNPCTGTSNLIAPISFFP